MWMPNLVGPFVFDPDASASAADLDEWEITWGYRQRHKPTGCEFRTAMTTVASAMTRLRITYPIQRVAISRRGPYCER